MPSNLLARHAGIKTYLKKNVTVKHGASVTENFEYEAPKGRRSVHEMHDNPHFGLELLGEGVEIDPTLRLQKTSLH